MRICHLNLKRALSAKRRATTSLAALLVLLQWCGVAHAVSSNQFSGTCQDLQLFVNTVGVEDADGNHHPGKAGWTIGGFDA
jgi:hypothetical protein